MSLALKSILPLSAEGLFGIAGDFLVWLWLREGRTVAIGAIGRLVQFL